jgi:hypothetical protein
MMARTRRYAFIRHGRAKARLRAEDPAIHVLLSFRGTQRRGWQRNSGLPELRMN